MAKVVLIAFVVALPVLGKSKGELFLKFKKDCHVYQSTSKKTEQMCQMFQGDYLKFGGLVKKGFAKVSDDSCSGFVPKSCVKLIRRKKKKREAASEDDQLRELQNEIVAEEKRETKWSNLRVQLGGGLDSSFALQSSSTNIGTGFGFGSQLVWPVSRSFRLGFGVSFESLALNLSAATPTGITVNGDIITVHQNIRYLTAGLYAQLGLLQAPRRKPGKLNLWLDAGFEYLYPLSGTQSVSYVPTGGGNSTTTTNQDFSPSAKMIFAVAGVSVDTPISKSFDIRGTLNLFYNVSAGNTGTLLGTRLDVAFAYLL